MEVASNTSSTKCTLDCKTDLTNQPTLTGSGNISSPLRTTAEKLDAVVEANGVKKLPLGLKVVDFAEENRLELADGRPFHLLDLRVVEQRYAKWSHYLPRVDPFYAMKCNTDPVLLQAMFAQGAGFDCASRREIELALEVGCPVERIIFANPAKHPADLEFAASVGVTMMTFDSEDELHKIAEAYQTSSIVPAPVIRIITDDSHSVCKFSQKFGADINDCQHLLTVAAALCLPVVGVSFHVGSGCASVYSFTKAIRDARRVFNEGLEIGHPMHLLDLGGGWPGDDLGRIAFPTIAKAIAPLLNELFPSEVSTQVSTLTGELIPSTHIIAEPGRYFAHASMVFATPIISRRLNTRLPSWVSKKAEASQNPHALYYIGDGVYGAFNCILYDHYTPDAPFPVFADATRQAKYRAARDALASATGEAAIEDAKAELGHIRAKVFGPTCDGLDTIYDLVDLPQLEVGEWLLFGNMGAYTVAAQSSFNGVPRPKVLYVQSDIALHDFAFVETQEMEKAAFAAAPPAAELGVSSSAASEYLLDEVDASDLGALTLGVGTSPSNEYTY